MARRFSPASAPQVDAGKYVRYTPEQVEALERVYSECPKPTSLRRQQIVRECPVLGNIEPRQIKVWFQNRRSVARSRIYLYCRVRVLTGNAAGKEAPFSVGFV